MNVQKYIKQFEKKTIVVIGDVMLDKYIIGKVERISPEAPVPVIEVQSERFVPGGAANAATNVATLSGYAHLFGIVGNDTAKEILVEVLKSHGINTQGMISDPKRQTIQKIRVVGQNQQLVRVDYEDKAYMQKEINEAIYQKITEVEKVDAVLISDYAKGVICESFVQKIIALCKEKKIPLIVDPKPKHKKFYKNATVITPNKAEAQELSGISLDSQEAIVQAGKKISNDLNCDVLLTRGEEGMSVFEKDKEPIHIATAAKEVFDVSGAGDTVIATLSLAIAAGASLHEAAILANHAAGIKVSKLGTAPVSYRELESQL